LRSARLKSPAALYRVIGRATSSWESTNAPALGTLVERTTCDTILVLFKTKDAKNVRRAYAKELVGGLKVGSKSSSSNFPGITFFVKKVGTNPLVRAKSARFGALVPSQFVAS